MNNTFGRPVWTLLILLFLGWSGMAQVKICSWNLQNFGKSKSDAEVQFIASSLKDFDVVALQEIVAGFGGPQAVARLADALNRTGAKWDYVISAPTSSSPYSSERYAFLWKPGKVKQLKSAWLDSKFKGVIDREPFFIDFSYKEKTFTLVNFHAIPKKKQPETEIKYFKFYPGKYADRNLVFLGDFNVPQSHTVFIPLRNMGFLPVFEGQRTTLKMACINSCLASEYDNIFYDSRQMAISESGIIPFYQSFSDMKAARRISDHVPIWVELDLSRDET